jgi:hypothetical protein
VRQLAKQKKISEQALRTFVADFGILRGRESIFRVRDAVCAFEPPEKMEKATASTNSEGTDGSETTPEVEIYGQPTLPSATFNPLATTPNGSIPDYLSIVVSCVAKTTSAKLTKSAPDAILPPADIKPNHPLAGP